MRRVRLECQHQISTTGDKTQPVKVGALRWCGLCRPRRWQRIERIL